MGAAWPWLSLIRCSLKPRIPGWSRPGASEPRQGDDVEENHHPREDREEREVLAAQAEATDSEVVGALVAAREDLARFLATGPDAGLLALPTASPLGPLPVLTLLHAIAYQLAVAALDLGGRPALVYKDRVKVRVVGDLQTELIHDFFDGFVNKAGANVHVKVLYGRSNHHKIEAIFKCFARAMRYACSKDARLKDQLPSTKGLL